MGEQLRTLIADVATEKFRIGAVGDVTPEEGVLLVLVDEKQEPAGLAGPDGPGPAVVVPADAALVAVLHSEEVLEAMLGGAIGLIVTDADGRPVGVVSAAGFRAELAREMAAPHELGDAEPLGRRHDFPPPIRILCGICGQTNSFARFQQTQTYRCQQGDHDFVAYYEAR